MYWQQVQVQKRHSGLSVYEHRSLCRKKKGKTLTLFAKMSSNSVSLTAAKRATGASPWLLSCASLLRLLFLSVTGALPLCAECFAIFSVGAGCAIKTDAMCDPKFPRERRVEGRHQYGGCVLLQNSGTALISPPHYSCSTCTPPPPFVLPLLSAPRQRTAGWHTQPPCTLARPPPPPQTSATRPAIQPWPCQAQQHVSPVPATSTTLS